MSRRQAIGNYKHRLKVVKKKLSLKLEKPEECLDVLEKILKKKKPVARNFVWNTVDERFHDLVSLLFQNSERYMFLMKRYDKLTKVTEDLDKPLIDKVRDERDLGGDWSHWNDYKGKSYKEAMTVKCNSDDTSFDLNHDLEFFGGYDED